MAKVKSKKKVAPKTKSKPVAKKVSKPAKKVAPKSKKPAPAKKVKAKVVAKGKPVAKKATAKPVKKVAPKAKIVKQEKRVEPKKVAKPTAVGNKVVAKPVMSNNIAPKANNGTKPAPKINMKKTKPENELNMRYSDEELKEFKDLIDKKLIAAREELKNLKEALDNHTESQVGNKAWNMEEGTDTSEMEYLMNQISRQHQYIRNLELAMIRIENKTYGICRVTSKLIPKERLRIVPHATLSLEAKMTRKKEDVSPGASLAAPPTDFSEGFED